MAPNQHKQSRDARRRSKQRAPHPSRSSERRERKAAAGPCPIMHRCGGCAWLGVPYRKQLLRKQELVDELFAPLIERFGWDVAIDPVLGMRGEAGATREAGGGPASAPQQRLLHEQPISGSSLSGIEGADLQTVPLQDDANVDFFARRTVTAAEGKLPAPRRFRYKAATPFAPTREGGVRAGFFAAGTHRIVTAKDCIVEASGARHILNEVARIADAMRIPAYHEDSHRGLLRHAVLRLGWSSNEGLLTVVAANRTVPHLQAFARELQAIEPRITGVSLNVNPRPGNAIWGPDTRTILGADTMHDQLLGCTFEISPGAFYQTNPAQTEVLYQLAIDGMDLQPNDVLLDAYCGSGTIGIAAVCEAARRGCAVRLIGVERNPSGIADARRNARLNNIDLAEDGARFIAEDATAYLRRTAAEGERADVLCMDPPRAGSTPAFLDAAAAMGLRRIVYVSCNPVTQVRDIEQLGLAGYTLTKLTPVDMFPHSSHIETVAVLTRDGERR